MSLPVGPGLPEKDGSCIFYKLIVASILEDKKLRIPDKFVRRYGEELSSVVTLTVPNGGVWLVVFEKVNQKFWFLNGWHEFVEYYSIQAGYFLVFRYEGKSNFNVHIYDLRTSEIKYPCATVCNTQELHHHDKQPLPDSVNDGQNNAPGKIMDSKIKQALTTYGNMSMNNGTSEDYLPKTDAKDGTETFRSTRDIGVQIDANRLMTAADEVDLHLNIGAEPRTKKIKQETESGKVQVKQELPGAEAFSRTYIRRERIFTAEEKERAYNAALMFKPNNPSCTVILRPSYVYKGLLLHMPCRFARKYLSGVTGFITLQVPEGKEWTVRCVTVDGAARLGKGWPEFVWQNDLNEGDVCVFELISTKSVVLKVTIFRVVEFARAPAMKH